MIDLRRFEVFKDEVQLVVTSTEFKMLRLFLENPGAVYTRNQIVIQVHGEQYPVTDRSIDVQIVNLRRKLANFSDAIETVRGIGYRLKEESNTFSS